MLKSRRHDLPENREWAEGLLRAYEFLKNPPLDPAMKAVLDKQLAAAREDLVNTRALIVTWDPSDYRIEQMIGPKEALVAELEGRLGYVVNA